MKEEIEKALKCIDEYEKEALEHQEKHGFESIFDELFEYVYEIEEILMKLKKQL